MAKNNKKAPKKQETVEPSDPTECFECYRRPPEDDEEGLSFCSVCDGAFCGDHVFMHHCADGKPFTYYL